MRIKKIGKRVYNSYSEWRSYITKQREINIMQKKLVPAVNKLIEKLYSVNNVYLGEKGLYHEMEKLRNKTNDIKKEIIRFINLKQFKK
tara:strand:- start:937 stop:1200 length:264 start_codon:yes stop_codon:yes gene_type:complete